MLSEVLILPLISLRQRATIKHLFNIRIPHGGTLAEEVPPNASNDPLRELKFNIYLADPPTSFYYLLFRAIFSSLKV